MSQKHLIRTMLKALIDLVPCVDNDEGLYDKQLTAARKAIKQAQAAFDKLPA